MPCFKNAQEVSHIALLDRAFHYGDGCFSTGRIREGKLLLQDLHFARLALASARLQLNASMALLEQTLQLIGRHAAHASGTVKIVISRGEGQRGYSLPDHPADVWVFFSPQDPQDFAPEYLEDCGVLSRRLGVCMPELAGLKTLNRLEQVMLKAEADQRGWKEALAADVQDSIVEGVSSNCFIQINDTWVSPELRYNGVHGVMRAEILRRMQASGIVCMLRNVDIAELAEAQSLFFCNALSPMKIAGRLQGAELDTQACVNLFHNLQLDQIR